MTKKTPQFKGFPLGKVEMVAIPDPFFSDLLPLIDDLAELKLILFCLWALPQKDGEYRYLRREDFVNHAPLMQGLATIAPDDDPHNILDEAIESAIGRGALLSATLKLESGEQILYFVNTVKGQTAIEQIQAGKYVLGDELNPIEILPQRPTIYKLYESNIGALTPMIADELKDMDAEFPAEWLEEALKIAVQMNKRNLRYIRAILERWRTEGKSTDESTKTGEDWERYVTGKYADFIEH